MTAASNCDAAAAVDAKCQGERRERRDIHEGLRPGVESRCRGGGGRGGLDWHDLVRRDHPKRVGPNDVKMGGGKVVSFNCNFSVKGKLPASVNNCHYFVSL